jgi:hypothetical protein
MSLDWDRTVRVTPAKRRTVFRTIGIVRSDRVPGSAYLELSCGVGSLQQAPWWNADRRRVPLDARRARAHAGGNICVRGAEVDYASAGVPLPVFLFLVLRRADRDEPGPSTAGLI